MEKAPGETAEILAILIECEERIVRLLGLDPKHDLSSSRLTTTTIIGARRQVDFLKF